ncbi:Hypothetical predicted protein [Mytilus galloprovincialis]|uniref:Integrase catalytic domain-containing protein n=1 Tax=Mytilus galloprovincialis TaxID=29158 RepID=A0A8B6DKR1_MYTGA|nr:Hypothetical predicted protein [Mytilus galloprovincialis]
MARDSQIRQSNYTFSRCGIPDIFYSDNRVQFSSLEFKDFAKDYGFQHLTFSPTYAQSNGQAERTVQTIKSLLKKSKDPYKSLLDYRSTAITELELSPAQIFYGRRLKTTLPTTAPLLNVNNSQDTRRKLKERQSKYYYDRHSKPLEPLQNGQKVLVHNGNKWSKHATVKRKHHTPRSYVVETADGRLYQRNRKHLRPTKCNKDQHTQNIVPTVNHNHQVHREVINTPSADETSACVTQSFVTKTSLTGQGSNPLDKVQLDWTRINLTGQGSTPLDKDQLDWTGINLTGQGSNQLDKDQLDWTGIK